MLGSGEIVGVNIHKQCVVIDKPVICTSCCSAKAAAFVGQIKVLVVCGASTVMISNGCHAGQGRKCLVQISGILLLVAGCVDLISCREKEVNIHFILNGIQRLVPAFDIFRCAACADLRIPYESEAEI